MLGNKYLVFPDSLIALGLIGLLISLLGEITTLGQYKNLPPRTWEKFDQQLVIETPDFISLRKKSNSLASQATTEQEKILAIYRLVINRFTHGDQAKYNIFSNWILWIMGAVHPAFSHIRQPDVLLNKGYSALCGEQAYLLQTLAEAEGMRTRAVGLYGHVVMEAWYDNEWHLYDPDLEVVPLVENQKVLSLDELAKSPDLIRKFYTGRGNDSYIESIVEIIGSREDNSFASYPRLVLFEWKSNVLFHFEKITNIMKWILPMISLIIGFGLYIKETRMR